MVVNGSDSKNQCAILPWSDFEPVLSTPKRPSTVVAILSTAAVDILPIDTLSRYICNTVDPAIVVS